MLKATTIVAAGLCLALSAQSSMAVGFGRLTNATTLGQSLDVTVPIDADVSEQITSGCVGAAVVVGESVLPPQAIQTQLEPISSNGSRLLRVKTTVRIHEPIVSVTVFVACPSSFSREFVVFVDPPLTAFEPVVPLATEPPDRVDAPSSLSSAPPAEPVTVGRDAVAAQSGDAVPQPEPPVTPPATRTPRPRVSKSASSKTTVTPPVEAAARKPRSERSAKARSAPASPRLQLEGGVGAVLPAPAAASAAVAPPSAPLQTATASTVAPTDAERAAASQSEALVSMQQRLDKLQAESEASSKSIAQLEARLRDAEASRSIGWTAYALGLAGALLLLWMGLLLGRRASASRSGSPWWNAETSAVVPGSVDASSSPAPRFVASTIAGLPEVIERTDDVLADDAVAIPPISQASRRADVGSASSGIGDTVSVAGNAPMADSRMSPRLTADELIDLEQQAAFFVALGQDDTAVDLLNEFLRGHGMASPLPYLKLLEIHRRRGDRDAYERDCERYQQGFGNPPEGWDDAAVDSRGLEGHAQVIKQLGSVWPDPAAAMRLIESMLVDGDRTSPTFDLPTFGDLQFLYLLARSERDSAEPAASGVDLLLPLSQGVESRPMAESLGLNARASAAPIDSLRSISPDIDLELEFPPKGRDPQLRA